MRKWILLVIPTVILLALIIGDRAAKGWAESKLAERAAAYYPPGSGSSGMPNAAIIAGWCSGLAGGRNANVLGIGPEYPRASRR